MKFETWVKQQIDANKKQIKSYQDEIKSLKEANKAHQKVMSAYDKLPLNVVTEDKKAQHLDALSKFSKNRTYSEQLEKNKIPKLKKLNGTLANLTKRKLAKVDGLLIHYGMLLDYAKKLNTSRLQVTVSIRNNELQLHYKGQQGTNGLLSLFDITAQITDAPNDLTYDTYTLEDVQACFKY